MMKTDPQMPAILLGVDELGRPSGAAPVRARGRDAGARGERRIRAVEAFAPSAATADAVVRGRGRDRRSAPSAGIAIASAAPGAGFGAAARGGAAPAAQPSPPVAPPPTREARGARRPRRPRRIRPPPTTTPPQPTTAAAKPNADGKADEGEGRRSRITDQSGEKIPSSGKFSARPRLKPEDVEAEALDSRRRGGLDDGRFGGGAARPTAARRESARRARPASRATSIAASRSSSISTARRGTRTTSTTRRAASSATASTIRRCSATRTTCARRRTSATPSAPRSKNRLPSCAPRWRRRPTAAGGRGRRRPRCCRRPWMPPGRRRHERRRRPRCRRPEAATGRRATRTGPGSGRRASSRWSSRAGAWRWASPEPCCATAGAVTSTTSAPSSTASRCRASPAPGPDCRGQYDAVKSAERMMWIGYVGAGVFTAAGVTLLLLAPRPAARRAGPAAVRRRSATTGVACAWTF